MRSPSEGQRPVRQTIEVQEVNKKMTIDNNIISNDTPLRGLE
jgi:hypothetical protein